MPYQTRPRYQARIDRRTAPDSFRPRRGGERELVGAPAAAAPRWESTPVLDALTEMHNAPVRQPTER